MWVTMVIGFDRDSLLIPKWRNAFLQRGAHLAELTVEEEEVGSCAVEQWGAPDDPRQGCDAASGRCVVRYAKDRVLHISGIAQYDPFNRWRAQAWRMEIASLSRLDTVVGAERPPPA